jgi:hypothetical protein
MREVIKLLEIGRGWYGSIVRYHTRNPIAFMPLKFCKNVMAL